MKKITTLFGILALALPMSAQAFTEGCAMDNTGGDRAKSSTCDPNSASDVTNLSSTVDIQASAGVYVTVGDGTATGLKNALIVGGAHENGNASYAGDTDGGSAQEFTGSSYDPSEISTKPAQSAAQAAAGQVDS